MSWSELAKKMPAEATLIERETLIESEIHREKKEAAEAYTLTVPEGAITGDMLEVELAKGRYIANVPEDVQAGESFDVPFADMIPLEVLHPANSAAFVSALSSPAPATGACCPRLPPAPAPTHMSALFQPLLQRQRCHRKLMPASQALLRQCLDDQIIPHP